MIKNKNRQKIFIGVAWPYVNGDQHVGHLAGYLLPADIYARFHRFLGNEVLMVSGSDCFGTPVALEAEKRDKKPIEIVKEYHSKDVRLFKDLNLSYDLYTKTMTDNHKEVVQKLFLSMLDKGYIFKDSTKQYYSKEEKRFLPDRYVEGTCPKCGFKEARSDQCDECSFILSPGELINPVSKLSGAKVVVKESEHYFVDWSKFTSFLKDYLKDKKGQWKNWVYKETIGWLKQGLKPRAITRDLEWGVELPVKKISKKLLLKDIQKKRIYVWFEAVVGYLSASIEWAKSSKDKDWRTYWFGKNLKHYYFMGKDNLVFHTLFWPAQLYSFDPKIHLPDFPMINQFLALEGKAFSKSRGITIDVKKLADDFGLDVVRFYVTLIMPENADANFAWDDFFAKTNDVVIGNLGNFIHRVLKLAQTIDINSEKLSHLDPEVKLKTDHWLNKTKETLCQGNFKNYAERILRLSAYGNKYLSEAEPWLVKEKGEKKFAAIIINCLYMVLALNVLLVPITPNTALKLNKMLGVKIKTWPSSLTDLLAQVKVTKPSLLFKKIEKIEKSSLGKYGYYEKN